MTPDNAKLVEATPTDRELLELAAKAAGHTLTWSAGQHPKPKINGCLEAWRPRTDDADAFKLLCVIWEKMDYEQRASVDFALLIGDVAKVRDAIFFIATEIGAAASLGANKHA